MAEFCWSSRVLIFMVAICLCSLKVKGSLQKCPSKPNFVVFFVDDMGLDQIEIDHERYDEKIYGYTGHNKKILTPNIARLAAEGLVFQTWYSSFHVCSPSRSSMMTGRLPVRTGIGVACGFASRCYGTGMNQVFSAAAVGGLQANETTTAEALRDVGYRNMMVGKWHLGQREQYLPTNRGFHQYFGIPYSQDMGTSAWAPKRDPEVLFSPLPLLNGTRIVEQPCDLGTLVKKYTSVAKDFIASTTSPFYLYFSFNHIHTPVSSGAEFCGKSKQGALGDSILETDWAIGQVMESIRVRDSTEGSNTLVFFTSDNGAPTWTDPYGNNPLRGGKGSVWEGGFREPGIVWGCGVKPGLTQSIASTMDIHATVLKQAGIIMPKDRVIDGNDLTQILLGNSNSTGHSCYPFYSNPDSHNPIDGLAAVRCGGFKVYWRTTGSKPPAGRTPGIQRPPLMFDLRKDPGEHFPIDSDSTVYAEAMGTIEKWRQSHLKSVRWVTHQTALGSDPRYRICSNRQTDCVRSPENWKPDSVCQNPMCKQRQNLKCSNSFQYSYSYS